MSSFILLFILFVTETGLSGLAHAAFSVFCADWRILQLTPRRGRLFPDPHTSCNSAVGSGGLTGFRFGVLFFFCMTSKAVTPVGGPPSLSRERPFGLKVAFFIPGYKILPCRHECWQGPEGGWTWVSLAQRPRCQVSDVPAAGSALSACGRAGGTCSAWGPAGRREPGGRCLRHEDAPGRKALGLPSGDGRWTCGWRWPDDLHSRSSCQSGCLSRNQKLCGKLWGPRGSTSVFVEKEP